MYGEKHLEKGQEIEGFPEFYLKHINRKKKPEMDIDSNLIYSEGIETRDVMEGNNDRIIKALEWKEYKSKFSKNTHLSKVQNELYQALKINDLQRLKDLGITESLQLDFRIDLKPNKSYPFIILATAIGYSNCLELILKNKSVNINAVDPENGCNAFWYASFYCRPECMSLLAKAGIDIMSTSNKT